MFRYSSKAKNFERLNFEGIFDNFNAVIIIIIIIII